MRYIRKYGVGVALLCMIHISCSDDRGAVDDKADGGATDTITDGPMADSLPQADLGADQQLSDGNETVDSVNMCAASLGSATLTGTFKGNALSANKAAGWQRSFDGETGYRISLWASGSRCDDLPTLGGLPELTITLCSTQNGTHTIGETCSGSTVVNEVAIPEMGVPPIITPATSGTVTIDSLDAACGGTIKGSFTVDFSGDAVSGTFDTVGCGTL